jgi:hypothetical protein
MAVAELIAHGAKEQAEGYAVLVEVQDGDLWGQPLRIRPAIPIADAWAAASPVSAVGGCAERVAALERLKHEYVAGRPILRPNILSVELLPHNLVLSTRLHEYEMGARPKRQPERPSSKNREPRPVFSSREK